MSDPEPKFRRSDLSQVTRFHRLLEQKPGLGLVLSALCVVAAVAMAQGFVGRSPARASDDVRAWVGAALWGVFGLYVGGVTARGLLRRQR